MTYGMLPAAYSRAVTPIQSRFAQGTPAPSQTSASPSTDTVTLSDVSRLLSLSSLFPNAQGGTVTLQDIRGSIAASTAYAEERLQSFYREAGISSSEEMKITVGSDGRLLVSGRSPECDALEQAVNADDEFSNTIRKMSAETSLLAAFKRHQEFTEAYQRDPAAAVQQFGRLLEDGVGCHVSFSIRDGGIDTEVNCF